MVESETLTPAGRRVLDAASGLFYRVGINPVGVALVAETAGVTKKTLYDCFGSKDALVGRYLAERHRRWWAHLEERLEGATHPRALVLFDAYVDHPELDTDRGCAFLNAAAELPADHPATAIVREHKTAVRRRLAELVAEDGGTADTAEMLYLMLEGATVHLRLGDRERFDHARRLAAELLGAPAAG